MYAYKQKRHNELMNKLQKSYEENRNLLKAGGNDAHERLMETHLHNNFGEKSSNYHERWQNSQSSTGSYRSGFVMPKIKYRHIEDKKPNRKDVDKSMPIIETTLQK